MYRRKIVLYCKRLTIIIALFLLAGCALPKIIAPQDPLNGSEHRRLAAIYEERGDFDLAEREYKAALEVEPESMASYFGLGNLYLKRGKYRQAKGIFTKALEINPSSGSIHNNLSWAWLEMGDLDRAEQHVQRALELDPSRRYIYLDTLGVINTGKGEFDKAEVSFLEALNLLPVYENVGRAEVYTNLIELYRLWGKSEEAYYFKQKLIEAKNHE
ncbi:MAG: tetratricopeptide repeat protein [Deltaproteobacteria bacterium]|nr:tetratricopeptide repeat protein [Deltaproteobacteria bacterium]